MNPLSNLSYLLQPLVTLVASIILFIIVWRGTQRNFSTNIFCALLASVALWSVVLFGMRSSHDAQQALYWDRAISPTVYTTYLLYYHFTLAYTNTRGQRGILLVAYFILVVIVALSPTELLIEKMRLDYFGYAPVPGVAALPFAASGLFLLGGGLYNLFKRYKTTRSYEEKNRLLYLALAVIFPLAGALLDGFSDLPPATVWGYLIFCIICTIAIVKYHLLDIRVIVRKSLAYLFVSLMIATPYVGVLYLLHYIFEPILEPWWLHAIIILLLAIFLRPLYSWAQNLIDRLFYRDRYDYLKALEQFGQKTQSIVNLNELSSTFIRLVNGALRTSTVCLLLPSGSDNGFVVVSSIGLGSPPSGVVLKSSSLLIKWLKLRQRIVFSEEFTIVPQLQSMSLREKKNIEQMEAKLCVPIQTGPGQLSGILVLGQKLSQQPYSNEDMQLLKALSSQMAISLENARLYDASQREVEERKRAEEALRESEERFRKTFISQHDAIFVLDAKKPPRIIDCNPAATEVFGYTRDEMLGHTTTFLHVDEISLRKFQEHLYSAVAERGFLYLSDFAMKRKDGTIFPTEHSVMPLQDDEGKSVGWLSVVYDITKRKEAEEREREMQKELYLSSRLAAIGELAAGVAHQINNPLTGILGFSQRLLRKTTDPETSQELKIIHTEAERAAKIVQNLLIFARRREPKKEYSDVNNIVQSALELRAYELKTSNIEVITNMAPSLPKIMLDSHQIQEVFLNLILNAEQAMTEANGGGKLIIKTEENKRYVRITFTDDGPGIPAEHLDKIFDPFFTTKGEKSGTGLGLSVCHGIITEHGGRIYAKSKPGKGASFFVELPIIAEE